MRNLRVLELRSTGEGLLAKVGILEQRTQVPGGEARPSIARTAEVPLGINAEGALVLELDGAAAELGVSNVAELLV